MDTRSEAARRLRMQAQTGSAQNALRDYRGSIDPDESQRMIDDAVSGRTSQQPSFDANAFLSQMNDVGTAQGTREAMGQNGGTSGYDEMMRAGSLPPGTAADVMSQTSNDLGPEPKRMDGSSAKQTDAAVAEKKRRSLTDRMFGG